MKQRTFTFTAIILLLAAMSVQMQAQKVSNKSRNGYNLTSHNSVDNYNFVYVGGNIGYTNLLENAKDMTSTGGLGFQLGVGYEFRNSGFWMNAGLQYSHYTSTLSVDPYQEQRAGFAVTGQQATFYYDVTGPNGTSNPQDVNNWNAFGIPVMVGYYKMGFYVGAGAKLDLYLNPKSRSKGEYELSAKHNGSSVIFKNMPNYYYTTYPYDQTHKVTLNPEISLIGEVGYDLLSSMVTAKSTCHILKLGLYFEYGLNNMLKPGTLTERLIVNPNNATDVEVQATLNMAQYESNRINPFFIGARLTYVIGGSRTAHKVSAAHKGCTCYE